jgi:predicted glycoside hydrolase/deacetylase ChbG (UPF0249 family)
MFFERQYLCSLSCVVAFSMFSGGFAEAQGKSIAERLGYAADSKLLIIHADDLAVAHAVDRASFDALARRAVTSASVMVPCPWLTEVAAYAKEHPDADIGLHLTLNSEWKTYRWGPVAPIDKVPGLLDPHGYLYADVPSVAQHATAEEVEREIRAQVERALAAGIQPTHLDTHMGTVYASPAFAAAYMKVAREYHLPFLALRESPIPVPHMAEIVALLKDSDIVLDAVVSARPGTRPEDWKAAYLDIVRNLKPGLTQLIVHLGDDDAELQAITVGHPDFGAAWRQRDFEAITSPEFKKALEENHVILIGWKDLKRLL